ncbi:MAG: hypothetical protein K9L32_00620 [Chromatiaceae bacterium]|nr:hypothetical protein [Chromatiaceae bacterium]MCF8002708.1 hypothetical protein [Chromatiaceae bacterium]
MPLSNGQIVFNVDHPGFLRRWPTQIQRAQASDEISLAEFQQILEHMDGDLSDDEFQAMLDRDVSAGDKTAKLLIEPSHRDFVAFKSSHRHHIAPALKNRRNYILQTRPNHAGEGNLHVVYWQWARRNRESPSPAVHLLANTVGITGGGIGSALASQDKHHLITVVASDTHELIVGKKCKVIRAWNGPLRLSDLSRIVASWYANGAGSGRRPGAVDIATALGDVAGSIRI